MAKAKAEKTVTKSAKRLSDALGERKPPMATIILEALDSLAEAREKIRPLKKQEEQAKAILLASGLKSFESERYLGLIDVTPDRRLNLEKLKQELGAVYIESTFYEDGEKTRIIVSKK